jgi:uncharacterized iron-regulated membrane protein
MTRWKNGLAAVHRYFGIVFCLFFAMWFASGIVMLFQPYPALTDVQRFACLSPFDPGALPDGVNALIGRFSSGASRLRLNAIAGRPMLHVHHGDKIDTYPADTGEGPLAGDAALAREAARHCGFGEPLAAEQIYDDQWTVYQGFNVHRPLYRVPLEDRSGTVLYVSSRTGEVVQRTTRVERAWNWVGSVPHWIYFTAIRRDWAFWDALVWWLAGAASAGALAGLAIGLVRWRSGTARISPFRGALYWHHVTGLAIGVVVLAWIGSGMLSMDHGRLFSTGEPEPEQVALVAGPAPFSGNPRELAAASGLNDSVREIEWLRVGGQAYLAFRRGPGTQAIVSTGRTAGAQLFDPTLFTKAAEQLVPGAALVEMTVLDKYDAQYYGRTHAPRPLPVLRLRYDDPHATWFHIDLATGAILERLDSSRRAYRYWFAALHSHDLPWMLDRMALRLSWMTILCAAGFAFSCNGVWIAWKRLSRRPAETRTRPS